MIAIVAKHYGSVERMRLHNAEALRSGSHVTKASFPNLSVSGQDLAAESEFSELTLTGADR